MSSTACEMRIKVAGAVDDSIVDGPGLRFALFVQGCSHHCPGCHNPQSHDPSGGQWMGVEQILTGIQNNPLLTGVTLTGGEPFEQAAALVPLARLVREMGLELAAYSGYTFEQLAAGTKEQRELLSLCQVLVDGPYIESQRSLMLWFRGSKNQRILDVSASLSAGQATLLFDGRWQPEL